MSVAVSKVQRGFSGLVQDVVLSPDYRDGRISGGGEPWLEAAAPLETVTVEGYGLVRLLRRHHDITAVEQDLRLVSSDRGPGGRSDPRLGSDDELRGYERRLRREARIRIDRIAADGGQCDAVGDLAAAFARQAIASGVWTSASEDEAGHPREAGRRGHPASRSAWDLHAGPRLRPHWLAATTVTLAGCLRVLAEHPAQLAMAKANPRLVAGLVEESMRWVSPVRYGIRTASARTEIAGEQIDRGDVLVLLYAAANRDEAMFRRAEVFDVTRFPRRQIGFGLGQGTHGAEALARFVIWTLMDELIPRLKSIKLVAEPFHAHSGDVGGLRSLPVLCRITA